MIPRNKVRIMSSPYSSVKVGTVAVVEGVARDHFKATLNSYHHPEYDLYILALPHKLFRFDEVEPVQQP